MQELFTAFFNILNIQFTCCGITFTFLDIFYAGIILTIIGYFIGAVLLFALGKK